MRKVGKLVVSILFLFFLSFFVPPSLSQGAALGINNYHITFFASIGEERRSGIGVFNPSPYEEKIIIYIECDTCTSDLKIFGWKIGDKQLNPYQFISLSASELTLAPNTDPTTATLVWVSFHPKLLLINKLKISTPESINFFIRLLNKDYPGWVEIPYPTLLLGEKELNGRISFDVVSSTFGYMGVRPSVAATLEARARGMPLGSFILLLVAFVISIYLIVKRIRKIKKRPRAKKEEVKELKKEKKTRKKTRKKKSSRRKSRR